MFSVGILFVSCFNRFHAFHSSFNMVVFIVIISFLVFFSLFKAFKLRMFCRGLFSASLFNFLISGSNVFHIFFLLLHS